jgi:hypothetical protein
MYEAGFFSALHQLILFFSGWDSNELMCILKSNVFRDK